MSLILYGRPARQDRARHSSPNGARRAPVPERRHPGVPNPARRSGAGEERKQSGKRTLLFIDEITGSPASSRTRSCLMWSGEHHAHRRIDPEILFPIIRRSPPAPRSSVQPSGTMISRHHLRSPTGAGSVPLRRYPDDEAREFNHARSAATPRGHERAELGRFPEARARRAHRLRPAGRGGNRSRKGPGL